MDGTPDLAIGGVVIDFAAEAVRDRAGSLVELRPRAFAVLRYLSEHPDRLITKDELMAAVWPEVIVTDDSLVQCIHEIRRAVGDERHAILQTVPRRGYRLVVPAEPIPTLARRPRRRWLAVAAVLLAGAGSLAASYASLPDPAEASLDGPAIVAIVPFVNLAGDRASQALLSELAQECEDMVFRDFLLVRRGPNFVYRKQPAGELAVDYLFSGVIERIGDRLQIIVELTDARKGTVLWSERWDRPDDDIPAIKQEIRAQIANRLGGARGLIQQLGRAVAERKRPGERTAWENFLLGSGQLALGTRDGADQAVASLGRAVELDPDLSHASALLALARLRLAEFGADPAGSLQLAIEGAEQAVFINGLDPWAHAALGTGFRLSGDIPRARSEFQTALVLAPNSTETAAYFAGWAATGGAPERGAELADRLALLDPIVAPIAAGNLARAYFMAGRYRSALGMIERLPDDALTPALRAMQVGALAAVGRSAEAAASVAKAARTVPGTSIETVINSPGWGDAERRRLVETMRLARFPPCAGADALAAIPAPIHLPECAMPAAAQWQTAITPVQFSR